MKMWQSLPSHSTLMQGRLQTPVVLKNGAKLTSIPVDIIHQHRHQITLINLHEIKILTCEYKWLGCDRHKCVSITEWEKNELRSNGNKSKKKFGRKDGNYCFIKRRKCIINHLSVHNINNSQRRVWKCYFQISIWECKWRRLLHG